MNRGRTICDLAVVCDNLDYFRKNNLVPDRVTFLCETDGMLVAFNLGQQTQKIRAFNELLRAQKHREKLAIVACPLGWNRTYEVEEFYPVSTIINTTGEIESLRSGFAFITAFYRQENIKVFLLLRNFKSQNKKQGTRLVDLMSVGDKVEFGMIPQQTLNQCSWRAVWATRKNEAVIAEAHESEQQEGTPLTTSMGGDEEPKGTGEMLTTPTQEYQGVLLMVRKSHALIYAKELGFVQFLATESVTKVTNLTNDFNEGKWVRFNAVPFDPSQEETCAPVSCAWSARNVSRFLANGRHVPPLCFYDRLHTPSGDDFQMKNIDALVIAFDPTTKKGLLWSDKLGQIKVTKDTFDGENAAESPSSLNYTRLDVVNVTVEFKSWSDHSSGAGGLELLATKMVPTSREGFLASDSAADLTEESFEEEVLRFGVQELSAQFVRRLSPSTCSTPTTALFVGSKREKIKVSLADTPFPSEWEDYELTVLAVPAQLQHQPDFHLQALCFRPAKNFPPNLTESSDDDTYFSTAEEIERLSPLGAENPSPFKSDYLERRELPYPLSKNESFKSVREEEGEETPKPECSSPFPTTAPQNSCLPSQVNAKADEMLSFPHPLRRTNSFSDLTRLPSRPQPLPTFPERTWCPSAADAALLAMACMESSLMATIDYVRNPDAYAVSSSSPNSYPQHPVPQHPIPQHPIPQHPIHQHPISQYPVPQHPIPQHPIHQYPVPQQPVGGVVLSAYSSGDSTTPRPLASPLHVSSEEEQVSTNFTTYSPNYSILNSPVTSYATSHNTDGYQDFGVVRESPTSYPTVCYPASADPPTSSPVQASRKLEEQTAEQTTHNFNQNPEFQLQQQHYDYGWSDDDDEWEEREEPRETLKLTETVEVQTGTTLEQRIIDVILGEDNTAIRQIVNTNPTLMMLLIQYKQARNRAVV